MGSTMQEVSKIFFVAFWVFSFTHVKSQECSTGTIQYENVQKSDLLKTYENGATVKVNCATGYIGSYELQCENGNWRTINERECKKNPCGHPGDTPNGDFKLTRGSEFVFGATVKYTCRPGYNMTSGIDYRNCRWHGWDNAVPVCEAKPSACAPFSLTHGFMRKSDRGYLYTCDSDYKTFDGKWWGEVTCQGGQWSDTPLCISEKQCGQIPTVFQVINQGNQVFDDRVRHEFECEVGPCCFHCDNGKWQNQDCAYQKCPTPPYVENAVITSHEVGTSQQSVTYECRENYGITGQQKINCIDSKWGKAPTCTF